MATMTILQGQRFKLADIIPDDSEFQIGIACNSPGLTIDFSCFGLDANEKLSDDRYMTFFNQPTTPCGGVSLNTPAGDSSGFAVALQKLPPAIHRLTITAAVDGNGTMSQINNSSMSFLFKGVEVARFSFTGSDFSAERALILLEIYRKDGIWRVAAIGQGFIGGLDALIKHFGGTLAESTTSTVPPSSHPPVAPLNPKKTPLEEKIEKEASQLLNLVKEAAVALNKVGLQEHQAKVALCLDVSNSMSSFYHSGVMQRFAERILALGCNFDDNTSIDIFFFAGTACKIGEITINNLHAKLIQRKVKICHEFQDDSGFLSGVSYESAMERIRSFYFSTLGARNKPLKRKIPVYVIFMTDNCETFNEKCAINQIQWSSYEPVFWQFVGVGEGKFKLLEKFDTLSGRFGGFFSGCYLDNANFFQIETPDAVSDAELYNLLMTEYPSWIRKAKDKGMLILENDTGRNEGALDLWAGLIKKVLSKDDEDYEVRKRSWEALESQQNEVEQQQISLIHKYGDEKVFSLMDVYGTKIMFDVVRKYGDKKEFDLLVKYKESNLVQKYVREYDYRVFDLLIKYDGDEKVFSLMDVYGTKIMLDVVRKYGDKKAFDLLVKCKESNLVQKYVRENDYRVFGLLIKYDDEELVKRIMKKQYWQGQTIEQLQDSLGKPDNRDSKIMKTKTTETWKYHETGKGRYAFRITLENGLVVGWQGKL